MSDSGQGFTSSRSRLLAAIDRFGGGFPSPAADAVTSALWSSHAAINQLESLASLVDFMLALPAGRKTMLLVSDRLREDVLAVLESPTRADSLRSFCVQTSIQIGMSCRTSQALHRVLVAAGRANVVIYPVVPTGFVGELAEPNLRDLAAATGGFAVANTNAFSEAFERIAQQQSHYYLLGFNAAGAERQGRSSRLAVRVKRPGVQVTARSSRVSAFPDELPRVDTTDPASSVAAALASPVSVRGLPMSVSAAPFKASDDASVAVVIELDPTSVKLERFGDRMVGKLEVRHLALDASGKQRSAQRHTVTFQATAATAERLRSGLRLLMPIRLGSGRYELRIAAGNDEGAGSVVLDVDVPAFGQSLTMGGVLLSSAAAERLVTVTPDRAEPIAGPLMAPTTERTFAQEDVLTLYTELYEDTEHDGELEISASLLDSDGERVLHAPGQRVARSERSADRHGAGRAGFVAQLPLRKIARGDYAIQIQGRCVKHRGAAVSRTIPIEVR